MFVCSISLEPMKRFLNRFFLLKTEIHMKILNIEPILCNSRRLRYLQNKTAFQSKQVHIHSDLKWSSQHQSGLEMPWLDPYWPGRTHNWSLRGCTGHSVATRGISRPDFRWFGVKTHCSAETFSYPMSQIIRILKHFLRTQNVSGNFVTKLHHYLQVYCRHLPLHIMAQL